LGTGAGGGYLSSCCEARDVARVQSIQIGCTQLLNRSRPNDVFSIREPCRDAVRGAGTRTPDKSTGSRLGGVRSDITVPRGEHSVVVPTGTRTYLDTISGGFNIGLADSTGGVTHASVSDSYLEWTVGSGLPARRCSTLEGMSAPPAVGLFATDNGFDSRHESRAVPAWVSISTPLVWLSLLSLGPAQTCRRRTCTTKVVLNELLHVGADVVHSGTLNVLHCRTAPTAVDQRKDVVVHDEVGHPLNADRVTVTDDLVQRFRRRNTNDATRGEARGSHLDVDSATLRESGEPGPVLRHTAIVHSIHEANA